MVTAELLKVLSRTLEMSCLMEEHATGNADILMLFCSWKVFLLDYVSLCSCESQCGPLEDV